jgi:threonine aldolase
LLLGTAANIKAARRVRKVLGGGMRQAGFLAAAGIYALDHHVERLTKDHALAKKMGDLLQKQAYVVNVRPVETNIVIFELDKEQITPLAFLDALKASGILAVPFGGQLVRFVAHLDVDEACLSQIEHSLASIQRLIG